MLKNSAGSLDSMLTFAVGGFLLTAFSVVASIFAGSEIQIGDATLKLVSPDATIVSALLAASLVSYVTRRNVKDKYKHEFELKKIESKDDV